jgi:O-antigen/teichoic acid export membrane protein
MTETNVRQNEKARQGLLGITAPTELKRKSVRGGSATVLGQGVGMALQIGTTFVLARLLSPTDYGLQSMVITLTAFFSLFKDAGLSVATVQRETLTHEHISTLFWINLALGAFLTIVVASAGPFLAAFYKEPRLLWLTVASASIFLFNSLSVQHKALLDRAMRFSTSVKIDILTATIGSVIAIGMAALGCGYWSLICQNISLPIIGTAATWIAIPWVPGRPRWTAELRSMVRFGGTVTLNSFVVYVAYNTEKILLGRFWGAAPLGIYGRAYQLATLPVQQLIGAVHVVAFSVLSRMQSEGERLRRAYLRSLSMIVSLTIPVVISTALFSDEIVLMMLGQKWIGVAAVLRTLSPTVLVLALINPLSWFLQATGRVGRSLKIALLICPVVILGVLVGLHRGPVGVAMGYSTAMVLLFVPVVTWAIHRTGVTLHDYWDAIKRPVISGILGGVTGWLVKVAFQNALPPLAMLIFGLALSFAAYVGILLFVMGQKQLFADLLSHLRPRSRTLREENQEGLDGSSSQAP